MGKIDANTKILNKFKYILLPHSPNGHFRFLNNEHGQCSKPNGHLDSVTQLSLQCDYGVLDCSIHKHRIQIRISKMKNNRKKMGKMQRDIQETLFKLCFFY